MIEFINSLTGTRMFVVPEREAEYLAAGHTRVADQALPSGGEKACRQAEHPRKEMR